MNIGLPKTLTVNGREEPIRYEYTAVFDAIAAMYDPELDDNEKATACLIIIYENFENFHRDDYAPAYEALVSFVNNGLDDEQTNTVSVVDFEQDFKTMIPAINRIAGKEIRLDDTIHWWTFLSWFMEIGECTYSTILSIRTKRKKGQKLEKWEEEFYMANKRIVDIQPRLTDEEKEIERRLNALLDS